MSDLLEKAIAYLAENPGHGRYKLAEGIGVTSDVARRLLQKIKAGEESGEEPEYERAVAKNDGENMFLDTLIPQVRSLEEAIAYFKVDLEVWRVQKYVINQWGKGDMLQVKVWLERKVPEVIEDAIRQLAERSITPQPPVESLAPILTNYMLVMSLVDHHFGKLAWGEETGDDYDLKIAERLYVGCVERTLDRCNITPELIVLPIGNDFFHFDTSRGQTGSGTQMDVDTRPAKVFVSGFLSAARAIERLARMSNVIVKFVPGNHDPTWSHHLCVALWAWFRNEPRVTVDFSAMPDKYIEYGSNLIYFTHGDVSAANTKMLPLQVATMHPVQWGRTSCREIHIGHFHHQRDYAFFPTIESNGTIIRTLPSLCGTDHWHFTKGYKGNVRASLSFLYHEKYGLENIISITADSIMENRK